MAREHRELAELTYRFAAATSNASLDVEMPRAWLDLLAKQYLLANRMHMETEEKHLFPRALAVLTDQDWAEIEDTAAHLEDPVFGKPVADANLLLYERIVKLRG